MAMQHTDDLQADKQLLCTIIRWGLEYLIASYIEQMFMMIASVIIAEFAEFTLKMRCA